MEPEEKSKLELLEKFWFIPVILALVVVIIVGVLWVINQSLRVAKPQLSTTPAPIITPTEEIDADTAVLEQQGTSNEISEIETDLEATDLSDIDKELTDIEAELSSP